MTTPAQRIGLRLRLQAWRAANGDEVDAELLAAIAAAFEASDALEGELGQVVRDAVARLDEVGER